MTEQPAVTDEPDIGLTLQRSTSSLAMSPAPTRKPRRGSVKGTLRVQGLHTRYDQANDFDNLDEVDKAEICVGVRLYSLRIDQENIQILRDLNPSLLDLESRVT